MWRISNKLGAPKNMFKQDLQKDWESEVSILSYHILNKDNLSHIFSGLIVMMERSPVVLQELSAADLITDLFVKIFPSALPELSPIRQYPDI